MVSQSACFGVKSTLELVFRWIAATILIKAIKPTQHRPPIRVYKFHTLRLHTCTVLWIKLLKTKYFQNNSPH
jgi:hypothetical protein